MKVRSLWQAVFDALDERHRLGDMRDMDVQYEAADDRLCEAIETVRKATQ